MTKRERNPDGSGFDLYELEHVPEFYTDGATHAMVGPAVTKILFHRIEGAFLAGPPGGPLIEQRKPVLSLVIPTTSLVQLFAFLTVQMQTTNATLLTAIDQNRIMIEGLLTGQTPAPVKKLD